MWCPGCRERKRQRERARERARVVSIAIRFGLVAEVFAQFLVGGGGEEVFVIPSLSLPFSFLFCFSLVWVEVRLVWLVRLACVSSSVEHCFRVLAVCR